MGPEFKLQYHKKNGGRILKEKLHMQRDRHLKEQIQVKVREQEE
jgi:hypothetical protein